MTWLITGGAGYIGAHVVRALRTEGLPVVVLDDLSRGRRERLPADVRLYVADVADTDVVANVLADHAVTGVVHLAAKKQVAESMALPLLYYRDNIGGCESLLRAMGECGVRRLVFSSSAAVYGATCEELVREDTATEPVNPYGFSKLVCERMIRDVGVATGLSWTSLRYFNVAGAGHPALADDVAANLIPIVLDAVEAGRRPVVHGIDYPTPDGTCVRDYIHVVDLAEAHVAAVRALAQGSRRSTYNVGTGRGASVLEVLARVAEVTGRDIEPELRGRRAGDPARVVADARRIGEELGWRPRLGLHDMIESAWAARRSATEQPRAARVTARVGA